MILGIFRDSQRLHAEELPDLHLEACLCLCLVVPTGLHPTYVALSICYGGKLRIIFLYLSLSFSPVAELPDLLLVCFLSHHGLLLRYLQGLEVVPHHLDKKSVFVCV